jgi:prepilin-type N-terminal cleavage/methylation domain-containing protein
VATSPRTRSGFSLIEVLIALVILAVGLLGLQALGIGAARSTAIAQKNSRAAALATRYLESAMAELRTGQVPDEICRQVGGDTVSVVVNLTDGIRPSVRVVAVSPAGATPRQVVTMTSQIYAEAAISGNAGGEGPCSGL